MSKWLLIIKADTNDADYVHSINEVSEEDAIIIKRVSKAIDDSGKSDWGKRDMKEESNNPYVRFKDVLEVSDIDYFNDLTPSGEHGIHTIESIKLIKVEEEETLL